MIDATNVPDVASDELLARYLLYHRHIRTSDETIRPEAFIPHPRTELSVTRHRDATNHELWEIGKAVATVQSRDLHGRGDVEANVFDEQNLKVDAAPIIGDANLPDNPNHANVAGWPRDDRAGQRLLAIEIAAKARLERPPAR